MKGTLSPAGVPPGTGEVPLRGLAQERAKHGASDSNEPGRQVMAHRRSA